ncbi:MAG: hypothetical protein AAF614_11560 [Chloroflexota bacterium]
MTLLLIGHILGIALGAGGATMSDILFLTSITDNFLDTSELRLLKKASHVVIVGLFLLYVTGFGFIILNPVGLSQRFWAKATIVTILTINGFVMHRRVFPILEKFTANKTPLSSASFHSHSCLFIWTGTISAISWYTALILGAWRTLTLSYGVIMGLYFAAIIWAVAIARTLFYYFWGAYRTQQAQLPKM